MGVAGLCEGRSRRGGDWVAQGMELEKERDGEGWHQWLKGLGKQLIFET